MDKIQEILNISIDSKLLYSLNVAIQNDKIVSHITKTKGDYIEALLMSEEKIFHFVCNNKKSHTNVYTFDEINSINVIQRKRECQLQIILENKRKIEISDINLINANNFKEVYDKISSSLNDSFLKTASEDNIKPLLQGKKENIVEIDELDELNNKHKHRRIVDDKRVSYDTTFSSKYLNDLFGKRNVFLPNGTLNNIDKIWSKLDSFEIDLISHENTLNSQFEKIDSQVNINKGEINKINNYIKNSLSDEINKGKEYLESAIKSETSFFNQKLQNEILNLDKVDSRLDKKIDEISEDLSKKILSLEQEQSLVVKSVKNKLEDFKVNLNDLYVSKKSWIENSKLLKQNENSIIELEEFVKNNLSNADVSLRELRKQDENISKIEQSINKFLDENKIFGDSISLRLKSIEDEIEDCNKIGNKFEQFKNDTNNQLKTLSDQSSNLFEKDKVFENEFKKIKSMVLSQNEAIGFKKTSSFIVETFLAKTYHIDGKLRYGLRSNQKVRVKTSGKELGLDAMYISQQNQTFMDITKYTGIIFRNQKYYFGIPNEFSIDNRNIFVLNHVDYYNGFKLRHNYQIKIGDGYVKYCVYNDFGEVINDAMDDAEKYDLKRITLFKE